MSRLLQQIASLLLSAAFVLLGPIMLLIAWIASVTLFAAVQFWFVLAFPLLLLASLAGGVFAANAAAKSDQSPALLQKPLGDE